MLVAHGELCEVPVEIELRPGVVTGLVGDRRRVLGVARSLLIQAAILHGPADLEITVVTDAPDVWDWTKWLPHTRPRPGKWAASAWSRPGGHRIGHCGLGGLD